MALTTQEELWLVADVIDWEVSEYETFGDFLISEETYEFQFTKHKLFGEQFMNMRKIYPFTGVIVDKGYIALVDKDK